MYASDVIMQERCVWSGPLFMNLNLTNSAAWFCICQLGWYTSLVLTVLCLPAESSPLANSGCAPSWYSNSSPHGLEFWTRLLQIWRPGSKRPISTSEGRDSKFQAPAQRLHCIACAAKSERLLREEIEFCLNRRKDTKIYSNCHPGAGRRCSVSGVKLSQPPVNWVRLC